VGVGDASGHADGPTGWPVGSGAGQMSGAGVVAEVGAAVGRVPGEAAGRSHRVAPAAVGLEPVMERAERGEVVTGGVRGRRVVGDDVVELAATGGARAPREHAGAASSR
jgi:hypothetical protein